MRSQQQQQQAQQQHLHHHHGQPANNKSPMLDHASQHCCSCNNCNSSSGNVDKDYYNMCECTSCRNLGNSIDICCQCCSCAASASEQYGPRYHVTSMAMQEDTLEVCLNQGENTNNVPDDIALAHSMAEQRHSANCRDCCHPPASRPTGTRPVFHGWQQQMRRAAKQQHNCAKGKARMQNVL